MCQKQETFGGWCVSKFVSGCGWRIRLSAVVTISSSTFFTGDFASQPTAFSFKTGFSICHSFLDSLYMGFSRHSGKLFVRHDKVPLLLLHVTR